MALYEFKLSTRRREFHDITGQVMSAVAESGVQDGQCLVYCPHTTAAITVNENADPDVVHDLLLGLDKAFPDRSEFIHSEGNSAAHLKSSCVGVCQPLIVRDGRPLLGTWQGVYFCEFDGPRSRRFYVQVSASL